jgi:hypothetical protein
MDIRPPEVGCQTAPVFAAGVDGVEAVGRVKTPPEVFRDDAAAQFVPFPTATAPEAIVPQELPFPLGGGVNCAAHDRAASAKTVTSFMVPLILDDSHGNV